MIKWNKLPSDEEDNEDFHIAEYEEKRLCIKILYEESQAILEATILGFDKEEERHTLEYFYKRVFVGFGKEGLKEKIDKMRLGKMVELEMIASGQDLKLICGI